MAKYLDISQRIMRPIPTAPWYVLSNDSFMSGWGYASRKINTCVVPCESLEQANKVVKYVKTRSDQKHIRIVKTIRSKKSVLYALMNGWKDRAKEVNT